MNRTTALLAASFLGVPLAAQQGEDPSPHSDARLVSELAAIRPGESFTVAVHLTMDAGWHSYWRNPGDAGGETVIEWTLPDGFTAGAIQWPHPHRIDSHLLQSRPRIRLSSLPSQKMAQCLLVSSHLRFQLR